MPVIPQQAAPAQRQQAAPAQAQQASPGGRPAGETWSSGTARQTIQGGAPVAAPRAVPQQITPQTITRMPPPPAQVRSRTGTVATGVAVGAAAAAVAPPGTARTEEKPQVNADGSRTHYHLNSRGERIGTTVVGANGHVLQSYRRNADGSTVTENNRTGTRVVTTPQGDRVVQRTNGTVVQEQTRNGERLSSWNRGGTPYQYRSREENFGRSTVYVGQPSYGVFDNPFFWLWLMNNNNNHHHVPQGGGYSSGGSYGTGAGNNYGGGEAGMREDRASPGGSASAQAPVRFEPFRYEWKTDFPHLPTTLATAVEYRTPQDWMVDYVIFDMISEQVAPVEVGFWWGVGIKFGISDPPSPANVDYNLPQDIRAELSTQIIAMVAKIRGRSPIRLSDYINMETSETTKVLIVANDDIEVRNPQTQETCTVGEGDVLELESQFPGSQTAGLKVRYAAPDAEACPNNGTVAMKHTDIQESLNAFVQRVERGISKAVEKRPGVRR